MKTMQILTAVLLAAALLACNAPAPVAMPQDAHEHQDAHDDHDNHDDHDKGAEELEKGAHGGRLLRSRTTQLELKIFEDGTAPEYRAWITDAGNAIAPEQVQLQITLARLGGVTDSIVFVAASDAQGAFLRSTSEVREPHSFDVNIDLTVNGAQHSWQYESYEGRTRISREAAAQAGVTTALVGTVALRPAQTLYGTVGIDPARRALVRARFPGPVKRLSVREGDTVQAGTQLAIVESNDSLSSYAITAPISGTVTQLFTSLGNVAGSDPLLELTDLSALSVQVQAFGSDVALLKAGLAVSISDAQNPALSAMGQIERVLPVADSHTGGTVARIELKNPQGIWRPGMAVNVQLQADAGADVVAVDQRALQRFRDWDVVFIQVGDAYEIRPLTLGRRDAQFVEVIDGISLGDTYVVEQSFLIKADIEKSGASHDH